MLTFGQALDGAGVLRADVCLLRHQDHRGKGSDTLYSVWRDDRARFEDYQRTMSRRRERVLNAPYWAAFVGTPGRETLFVGLYEARLIGPSSADMEDAFTGQLLPAGSVNLYSTQLSPLLAGLIGRLLVDWGPPSAARAWAQYAYRQDKPVVELRRAFSEPDFPGFTRLLLTLADVATLPAAWAAILGATQGVYLLTCPRTREQYVGSACGEGGLLARWRSYLADGHGGNVALKSREASDYQISILETLGSSAGRDDVLAAEALWKRKLQCREMGLNRN